MQALYAAIRSMIDITDTEWERFSGYCLERKCKRLDLLSKPLMVPNEIFFIVKGLVRVSITDKDGTDHSLHFALENQFIADYSAFIQKKVSFYTVQVLEETDIIVLPRTIHGSILCSFYLNYPYI